MILVLVRFTVRAHDFENCVGDEVAAVVLLWMETAAAKSSG